MSTLGYFVYVLRILSIAALLASAFLVRSRNRGNAMSAVFSVGAILFALYDLFYRVVYSLMLIDKVSFLRRPLMTVNRLGILLMVLAVLPQVGFKKPSVLLRVAAIGFAVLEAARSTRMYMMTDHSYLILFFVNVILVALLLAGSFSKGESEPDKTDKTRPTNSSARSSASGTSGRSSFSGANWMRDNAVNAPTGTPPAQTPARYDEKREYRDGLAAVKSGDRWGFVDQAGKLVVQPQFVWVSDYSEGFASVCDDSTYQGYIDRDGHYLVKPKYGFAKPFVHGLGEVKLDMKYGVVDASGREVVPLKYDDVNIYESGYVITELDDLYGLYDKTGKELLKPQYEEIEIEGSVAVYTDNGTKKELRL